MAQLDKKFEGGHGDVLETSAMMAIAPESVHLELSKLSMRRILLRI